MTRPETLEALAKVLGDALNLVAPLRYIFGANEVRGSEVTDALEVLLAQEVEHAVTALLEAIDAGQVPGLVLDRRGDGGRFIADRHVEAVQD